MVGSILACWAGYSRRGRSPIAQGGSVDRFLPATPDPFGASISATTSLGTKRTRPVRNRKPPHSGYQGNTDKHFTLVSQA